MREACDVTFLKTAGILLTCSMSDAILVRYNDPDFAQRYARRNFKRSNPTGLYKRREFGIVTREFLRYASGEHILDIGCGEGSYACALARKNRVVAIDASDVMLDVTASKGLTLPNLRVKHMDARSLSFDDGTFTVALCIDLLHHYSHEECMTILGEIRRVLEPSRGQLITELKNVRNPIIRWSYSRWMGRLFHENGLYVKARSHEEFNGLLRLAGFRVEQVHSVLFPAARWAPAVMLRCAVSQGGATSQCERPDRHRVRTAHVA